MAKREGRRKGGREVKKEGGRGMERQRVIGRDREQGDTVPKDCFRDLLLTWL